MCLDEEDFFRRVMAAYECGRGSELPVDINMARSFIPAGTAAFRSLSNIGSELPLFIKDSCTGCMDCVTACPDSAILAKVVPEPSLENELSCVREQEVHDFIYNNFAKTKKYYEHFKKTGKDGGIFGLFVDPLKCKGCGECVKVCEDRGTNALKMIRKTEDNLLLYRKAMAFYDNAEPTKKEYIIEKSLSDIMLSEDSLLFIGGSGSCAGCGEATAIRMMLAATAFIHGADSVGIVAATGCNTVYSSTYPYNVFKVPWMNSLFENSPAVALGLRKAWNKLGWKNKRIWVIGGDGAMNDIGFQSLSRILMSRNDIKVLVLDTQVYSNTGGQSSGSTFIGQTTKFTNYGVLERGKIGRRKELGLLCMMHGDAFVAQTTTQLTNHFYKSIIAANEFNGPAVVNVYSTCQPEHGVADNLSSHQARLAVYSRAFPLFIYDPRNGSSIKERLSLWGNPAVNEDWWINPKTNEKVDFITFARSEGRFAKNFDKDGKPAERLVYANEERLRNWKFLQELAGIKSEK
ncbi:MAG: 4Fe-4S binding protein [Planctomycetes bacterium]|nr:4Fe-4S binding protein [Planctomycetota bacterium]